MFVARKSDGSISGAWAVPQTAQQRADGEDNSPDWVADDDAELVAFLTPAASAETPLETSKLRFALELKARGMWPAVNAAIAANEDASMYWDFTDIVRSDNQMLLAMASQLNISAAEVRAIITAAIARQV